jgi:dTDP-D-glucose 4,6-dehydratase
VKDVADLYCTIGENIYFNKDNFRGEIFNAGTNEEKSVREVVETIYGLLKKDNELKNIQKRFASNLTLEGEINFQIMDFKKVEKYFGWRPKTSFLEGLNQTIKWYDDYLKEK